MTVPGFDAEASLAPSESHYRVYNAMRGSRRFGVSPMQQAITGLGPWENGYRAASHYFGRPMCTCFVVPVWYECFPLLRPALLAVPR